jgi:Nif-specific regulatory protein
MLEAVSGPLEGQVLALGEGELTIGREPGNAVAILDSSISRRHCLLAPTADGWVVRDLGSRNGTLVNGVPAAERLLAAGDEIRVGKSCFRFRESASDNFTTTAASAVLIADLDGAGPTMVLRHEESTYLRPGWDGTTPTRAARLARDLNSLVRFSCSVNSVRGVEELQRNILESVFEISPADRAAILIGEDAGGAFQAALGRERGAPEPIAIQVSRTIVRQVMDQRVSVLANDTRSESSLRDAQSLMLSPARNVIAVPLVAGGKVVGLIYLESSPAAGRAAKPFDKDLLELITAIGGIAAVALTSARHVEWLEGENQRLRAEINIDHDMVGSSSAIRQVYQFIAKVAGTEATVLIHGESGTGKELVARAIHRNSPRATRPFVAINCAAITETLLESELFGHEKGAFTGAAALKKGKLETAEGGTVFLDEIGELAPALQAKLLRVLQEREFERVGGVRPIKLDIRLIAATNRDLKEQVRCGAFRSDLYYRLNVVSIAMPPLRERRDDIVPLASHFAERLASQTARRIRGLTAEARARLLNYEWPGNVRELQNAIERAVVLGSGEWIEADDLPEQISEQTGSAEAVPAASAGASAGTAAPAGGAAAGAETLHGTVRETRRNMVLRALEQSGGSYPEAARIIGVHPNYFYRLVKNLGLKPKG